MKKLSLKKWLVLSSALLLAGYAIVKACSDIYYYPNSNFTPEAFVEEDYRPLLLSSDFFYTGYDDIHNERFNESIVSQWSDYLGHNVDKQLIDSVLFRADSSLMVSWTSNFEAFPIQSPKAKAANMLDFMLIAKQVEAASVNHQIYYWQERDVIRLEEEVLFEQIEKRFRTADHSFMKQRYWFQLIKAYFYSADKQGEIEPFFAATKDQMPKDDLYYQAMSYLAGAYYKQRDFVQSNVLYAEVFDQCTPLRKVALYSYHPQELEVFLQETLPQAKDNELLCALWALQGYYTEELPAIEAIHAIQADSPHLSYLLSRLINKQEWNIQAVNKEESFAENKTSPYTQVDKSMLPIIQKIADAEDTEKPEMWYLALGYMYMMDGQYQKSQDIYQAVSPDLLSSPLAKSQLRLLKLLTSLHMLTGESDEEIERLSEDLRWLYFDLPNETAEGMQDFRYELAFDWSQDFLSTYYKSKNNPIMEELFKGYDSYTGYNQNDNGYYNVDQRTQNLKEFLVEKEHTEIEKIALQLYPIGLSDIRYHEMILAIFRNNIDKALADYDRNGEEYSLPANPFNGYIQDNHDAEHAKNQPYDLHKMLINMKLMKESIAQHKEVYTNSLLLGNAFYNISHFGNARLYESAIIGYYSSPYGYNPHWRRLLTDCSLAASYYKQAYEQATNEEQKARAAYMLAKCERNEYYYTKYYEKSDSEWNQIQDEVDFLAWEGFQMLKNDYADTDFYQEVIRECGYFRTWVTK